MNLWLHPRRGAVEVDLERFRNYSHFFDSFEQYGVELPDVVSVVWRPLKPLLEPFDNPEEEAPFIREVAQRIRRGDDVPPVLVMREEHPLMRSFGTRVFDGRHRAWAAWRTGLRSAPVIDVTPYWPAAKEPEKAPELAPSRGPSLRDQILGRR